MKTKNKYFNKSTALAVYLAVLSLSLTSCNNSDVSSSSIADATSGINENLASCEIVRSDTHFNAGSGSVDDPYIICSEQQLLNVSLAVMSSKPTLISAGSMKFPYMNKNFKLGKSLNFSNSKVEFFSLGHFMGSVGRSSAISGSDKNLIATHDKRNGSQYVAKLSAQRVPFSGSLDGNDKSIEIGDYAPTESRLVGLFSVLAPGAKITDLSIKNFNIHAKGGVNIGCLAGSIIKSDHIKVWQSYGIPKTSNKIVLDNISIENCSLNDVTANSGALVGLVRNYPSEELSISDIKISQVKIDGAAETRLEPAYGDDLMQSVPSMDRMHNVGSMIGYLQVDGKTTISGVVVDQNEVSLEGFYTGLDRDVDIGDMSSLGFGGLDDVNVINEIFSQFIYGTHDAGDPARSVGIAFGAINTSSNLANLNISKVTVSNSKNSFYRSARSIGALAGSIGLMGGNSSISEISIKGNSVMFGIEEASLPSSGVGLMAGVLSIGSSGASHKMSKIKIDGQIVGDNAESSSDISGFIGSVRGLDEVVVKDNEISFSEIEIKGSAVLGGIDISSLGAFAGSLVANGNLADASEGANKISLSKINNEFILSTPDNYSAAVGGLAGVLGNGVYSLSEVVVKSRIDVVNEYGFYDFVNAVVGLFNTGAQVAVTSSSYDSSIRPEFVTGIPEEQDDFTEL